MAALHAPPGTWLCRSCGSDCGTSQARTHHERYCTSTSRSPGLGPKQHGPGVGNQAHSDKKMDQKASAGHVFSDVNGSLRVPTFRGVWITSKGKHFIKIKSTVLRNYFDSSEEAAKAYDEEVHRLGLQLDLNYHSNGTRIMYEDTAIPATTTGFDLLGGSVVPALSVINIKDLPKNVKPLLRDPRQTSRTGGNSKRFVYKYRGVCRQARKGHDRWQSQISFGGTNHYLGTFDNEWDAAAIYAWAHLILYGEEATKKAQLEGEQQQKDIATGKIPKGTATAKKTLKKKKLSPDVSFFAEKNKKKICSFFPDKTWASDIINMKDSDLMKVASSRIAARKLRVSESASCIPSTETQLPGYLMLLGLTADDFQWSFYDVLTKFQGSVDAAALHKEYGIGGYNSQFCCVLRGTSITLGRATKELDDAATSLSMTHKLGGPVGFDLDCHVGGTCSFLAAKIQYIDSNHILFSALNDSDVVTLNGKQVTPNMGSLRLHHQDVCGVGARVFIIVKPDQCKI